MAGLAAKVVTVKEVIEKMNLVNMTPEIDPKSHVIKNPEINRPALQLAGFFEHFDHDRIQIIGYVENDYYRNYLSKDEIAVRFQCLFEKNIPCLIYCRNLKPDEIVLREARRYGIPVLVSSRSTSEFMAEVIRWLNVELAPSISIHGVLVDVFGEGVLIMGESGIGKSEAALELVKRGHRLVSDDVVEIRRVSDDTLVGTAPDVTKYFIELRGIGIVDVKTLYGVASVKDTQTIDMVIKLEEWNRDQQYDRLGMEDEYTEFLGNKVICHSIPIRPGRNLAIIVESAAANYRQKKMGYNAAKELYNRVTKNMQRSRGEV